MVTIAQISGAASVLDDLAAGREPDRAAAIAAALTLDTLARTSPTPGRDLLDAAGGLEMLVAGRLDLDQAGRARAALLAAHVRALGRAKT